LPPRFVRLRKSINFAQSEVSTGFWTPLITEKFRRFNAPARVWQGGLSVVCRHRKAGPSLAVANHATDHGVALFWTEPVSSGARQSHSAFYAKVIEHGRRI
jgi:hypothetical protein